MFLYDYQCKCGKITEAARHLDDRDLPETCECGGQAMRIFTFYGSMSPNNFKPDFYHAFGKNIETKTQLKDTIRRYEGETGKTLVEVGNEKQKTKPVRKKVDYEAMGKELYNLGKNDG